MGVITFKAKLSELKSDQYLRCDTDYIDFNKTVGKTNRFLKNYVPIFDTGKPITKADYSENGDPTEYIHLVVRNIKNGVLNLEDPIYINEDKGVSLSEYKIEVGDIVVAISANCGSAFYFESIVEDLQLTLSHYLAKFKVDSEKINPRLLVYYLNSKTIQKYFRATETGKTQKNLSKTYLRELPIFLPFEIEKQNKLLGEIQPLEAEISELKSLKIQPANIINQVFADYFRIDLKDVDNLDKTRTLSVSLSSTREFNTALRSGMRWNKMQHIQDHLYSKINCIKTLGRFIKSTKNGWSPLSVDGGEGIPILGQENFSFDGVLKVEPSKATEETRNNIEDFFVKKGDFFVSRGNTVDLVALASVVDVEIEDDILFPDLYICVELDETSINKEYLSYIFNSFIGRLYFKYVAKGKNQTMVKVSSTELLNFRLPIPFISEQENLVGLIKTQLDEQKVIDRHIEEKQQAINKIIEDAIKTEQANA
jgi:type I restriction enzyme, S subunit